MKGIFMVKLYKSDKKIKYLFDKYMLKEHLG